MLNSNSTALIVEGSAMRSVYSAGLLDGFIEARFNPFDFYIGVSAGAYNLVAYLNETKKSSFKIFEEFATRKEFINIIQFISGGHLIDLDWLEQFAFNELNIDINAVYRHKKPLYVGMTEVTTGKPVYINTTPENIKSVIKASAALPLLYKSFPIINGQPMTDGGVAEGIPVAAAIQKGATRIMVIRARSKNYIKKDSLGHKFIRWKMKNNTNLLQTMHNRINIHNNAITLIRNPPPGVNIIEVCPPECFTLSRFCRNRKRLLQGYQIGYEDSKDVIEQWFIQC